MFALGEQRIGPQEAAQPQRRVRRRRVSDAAVGMACERRGADRGRERENTLVGGFRSPGTGHLRCDRGCRQPDRRAIANEIEAVERNCARLRPPGVARRLAGLSSRPVAHVSVYTGRKRRRPELFREGGEAGPYIRSRPCRTFLHPLARRVPALGDRKQAVASAMENAGRALLADELDPTAHWAMGRAQWLFGRHDAAVDDLKQSVRLSPNFALGHYALAFVQSQSGDPSAAIEAADYSRILSPFDPLLFGILGSRAMALVRLEHFEEAATWSVRAAAQPNAHVLILADCGSMSRARRQNRGRAHLRRRDPHQGAALRRGRLSYFFPVLRRRCCAVPPGCSTHRSGVRDGARQPWPTPAPLGSGGLFARS